MNITALQPSNENPDKGSRITPVFHALDPVERTSAQVAVLRGILATAENFLDTRPQIGTESAVPAEVKGAAAKTACLAFSQLDNIVDEMTRWSPSDPEHTQTLRALLTAETRRAQSEEARARMEESMFRMLMTPFNQQRGRLLQRSDGKYIAVNADQSFMAVSDSPAGAIDKFNEEFFQRSEKPKKRRARNPKTRPETA